MSSKLVHKKRKRGIKASRRKLEKAMREAGFKTQAEIAIHIADKEGLENIPKDFVSKVFRELPVAPASVERIANSLNVEAFTLYKSKNEDERMNANVNLHDSNPSLESVYSNLNNSVDNGFLKRNQAFKSMTVLALIGFVIGIVWFGTNESDAEPENNQELVNNTPAAFADIRPKLGKFSIILQGDELAEKLLKPKTLAKRLSDSFNFLEISFNDASKDSKMTPQEIINKYQSDFLLRIETIEYHEFVGYFGYLYTANQRYNIWTVGVRRSLISQEFEHFIEDLASAVEFHTGQRNSFYSDFHESANDSAMRLYLEGRHLLQNSQNSEYHKIAQSRFTNAIDLAPNFAGAHAGLCEALLHESWSGNEKALLEKARSSCAKAASYLPNNPYVAAANVFSLRRTGSFEEAISYGSEHRSMLENSPDFLNELVEAHYDGFRHTPEDKSYLERARTLAHKAIDSNPTFWKIHSVLGRVELSSGNTQAAIDSMAEAAKHEPNELSFANLGILNFCINNKKEAKHFLNEAINIAPNSYLGYEMMGLVLFFEKSFERSYEFRKLTLEKAGSNGIHYMYGAIADSAFEINQPEIAASNYQEAINIIARDKLRGNSTPNDDVLKMYYEVQLLNIAGSLQNGLGNELQNSLNIYSSMSSNLEPSAMLRLTIIYYLLKDFDSASKLLTLASARCPIYQEYPGLEELQLPST